MRAATLSDLIPPLQTLTTKKVEQQSYHFDPPLTDHLVLERVLIQAATRLADRLQTAGLEGRTFQLLLKADEEIFQTDKVHDLKKGSATSR